MKPRPPLTRVQAIQRSLRCFVLGLVGLLPVVGFPFAVAALFEYRRVRSGSGAVWNPASGYLRAGLIAAALSLLATLLLTLVILSSLRDTFE